MPAEQGCFYFRRLLNTGLALLFSISHKDGGVLDGMNDHGLAISLAFGGRRKIGEGFGITLVQRYVLENCADVAEACEVLCRIPVPVACNLAVVDRRGGHATVMLAPDRDPIVSKTRVATDHQDGGRWKKYTEMIESEARYHFPTAKLENAGSDPETFIDLFLRPPLHRSSYALG